VQSKRLHLQSLWAEFLVSVGATRWSIGEIVAHNLSKTRWSLGWVSAIDSKGERSGLLTHIVATESVSIAVRTKGLPLFLTIALFGSSLGTKVC
jgi:hypothetical protein